MFIFKFEVSIFLQLMDSFVSYNPRSGSFRIGDSFRAQKVSRDFKKLAGPEAFKHLNL